MSGGPRSAPDTSHNEFERTAHRHYKRAIHCGCSVGHRSAVLTFLSDLRNLGSLGGMPRFLSGSGLGTSLFQCGAASLPAPDIRLAQHIHTSRSSYGTSTYRSPPLPHQPIALLEVAGRDTCTAIIGTRDCLGFGLFNAPAECPASLSACPSGTARCPPITDMACGDGLLLGDSTAAVPPPSFQAFVWRYLQHMFRSAMATCAQPTDAKKGAYREDPRGHSMADVGSVARTRKKEEATGPHQGLEIRLWPITGKIEWSR